jgi:hypothetical protein
MSKFMNAFFARPTIQRWTAGLISARIPAGRHRQAPGETEKTEEQLLAPYQKRPGWTK